MINNAEPFKTVKNEMVAIMHKLMETAVLKNI
jgi:hypothetical protein